MGEWKENCNSWGGITLLPNLNISHSTTQLCLYFQQHLPSCLRKKKKKLPCLRSPATWPVAQTTDFGQNHHPCDAWRPNQSKWKQYIWPSNHWIKLDRRGPAFLYSLEHHLPSTTLQVHFSAAGEAKSPTRGKKYPDPAVQTNFQGWAWSNPDKAPIFVIRPSPV